jgi:hypothetical protein
LLGNIVAGCRRVWVISAFQPNQASRQVEAVLRAHFAEHRDRGFGFVHAVLFTDLMVRSPDHQRDCR